MQQYHFPTAYEDIVKRIHQIRPNEYGKTRNYIHGAVTFLSPYISRGVISVKQVWDAMTEQGYHHESANVFIKELAWREYFQRTWQWLEDAIFEDIRLRHTGIRNRKMPSAVVNAATGITSIDDAILNLYQSGYMHNHQRMYVAAMVCNMAKSYWQLPSQWMYYHLLDGDLASNTCSWQWVAGSFSSKPYLFNQENVNKYSLSNQQGSFLDKSYEEIATMPIPAELEELTDPPLQTILPVTATAVPDHNKPLLLYNSYNLDPLWRKDQDVNRLLLLEPSHFKQHPVSEKVTAFILALAKNIPGLRVFTGEVNEIPGLSEFPAIYSKEHPAFKHYPGKKDQRDWLFPEVSGNYPSFFSYWRQCEQWLKQRSASPQQRQRA